MQLRAGGSLRPGPVWATTALFLFLFAAPTHAGDTFTWTGACGNHWYECCDAGGGNNQNNWDQPPVAAPGCPAFPDLTDHVELLDGFTVILDQTQAMGEVMIASMDSDGSTFEHHTPGMTVTGNVLLDGPLNLVSDDMNVGTVLEVNAVWDWFGGRLAGPGTATSTVELQFTGIGTAIINERHVISTGTAFWADAGDITLENGGIFENQNIFEIRNNEWMSTAAGGGTFLNSATTTKLLSDGLTRFFPDIEMNNDGTFNINTGQVEIQGSGTTTGVFHLEPGTILRLNPGGAHEYGFEGAADFTGTGLVRITGGGTVKLDAAAMMDVENLEMGGGLLDNDGQLEIDHLSWTSGSDLTGAGTTSVLKTHTMAGIGQAIAGGHTLNTGPSTTWSSGPLTLDDGAEIVNGGTFSAQDSASLLDFMPQGGTVRNPGGMTFNIASASLTFDGVQGMATVDNDGTMNFKGTSCFMQNGVVLEQSGLFHVQNGEVRLTNQTLFSQTAGITRLQAGTTFRTTNQSSLTGGVIEGEGTVRLADDLDNQSLRVRPGLSAGTLTVFSDYMQSGAGVLEIELGGTQAGEFDLLSVTGDASLGGVLEVVLIDGFMPRENDEFVVLTAASVAGTFDTVTLVDFPPDLSVDVVTGATSVTLVISGLHVRDGFEDMALASTQD